MLPQLFENGVLEELIQKAIRTTRDLMNFTDIIASESGIITTRTTCGTTRKR